MFRASSAHLQEDIKYYSPLHVSSLKCSSSGGYSCIHAAYGTVTLCESSWWPVGTQLEWELTGHPPATFPLQSVLTQAVYRQATTNSRREWQYHMQHVYNCILLKMSTWGSKHVEENSVLRHPPTTFPLQSVLTLAAYQQATSNSYREWPYHMLLVYNYVLLKMSTWRSKHVQENSILWINNNQCINLVINV